MTFKTKDQAKRVQTSIAEALSRHAEAAAANFMFKLDGGKINMTVASRLTPNQIFRGCMLAKSLTFNIQNVRYTVVPAYTQEANHALDMLLELKLSIEKALIASSSPIMNICQSCGADLSVGSAVVREYVSKEGAESVYSEGHYDASGAFVMDSFNGFGGGRYDLHDDSDKCDTCEVSL